MKQTVFHGRPCTKKVRGFPATRQATMDQFISVANNNMHWYAEKRDKVSSGGLMPPEYRQKVGIAL